VYALLPHFRSDARASSDCVAICKRDLLAFVVTSAASEKKLMNQHDLVRFRSGKPLESRSVEKPEKPGRDGTFA
jgi:hypothetical protein